MGRKTTTKRTLDEPQIWYLYKFPAPNNMPKYAVAQMPNECINWRCEDEVSLYRTTHRHPELEELDDVTYEEFDASTLNKKVEKKGKK